MSKFDDRRKAQLELVKQAVNGKKTNTKFQAALMDSLSEGEVHDKAFLELGFRTALKEMMTKLKDHGSPDKPVENLIELGIWCSKQKLLDEDAVVKFLEDILGFQTITGCEKVFPFIKANLEKIITTKLFVKSTRLGLLRICNTLLKRLSKTTNTSFCGQILMLLANSLPLDERSGVNVAGTFNTNNHTPIEPNPDSSSKEEASETKKEDAMDVEGGGSNGDCVDYDFYNQVWNLQSIFVKPSLLSDPDEFSKMEILNRLFDLFEGNKVDHVGTKDSDIYYPKYLTGTRLLNLQLQDVTFRRHLLTQCYMLFAFINTDVKSKKFQAKKPNLTPVGRGKIKAWKRRVEKLLNSTPPHGEEYISRLKKLLVREGYWSSWKDNGCKPIEDKNGPTDLSKPVELNVKEPPSKKEVRGKFLFRRNNDKRMLMGDPILYRLWTQEGDDDLTPCQDEERKFRPTLKKWLSKVVAEEKQPDVTKSNSRRTNDRYIFRALRLMKHDDIDLYTRAKGKLDTIDIEAYVTGKPTPPTVTKAAEAPDKKEANGKVEEKTIKKEEQSKEDKSKGTESGAKKAPGKARDEKSSRKREDEPKERPRKKARTRRS